MEPINRITQYDYELPAERIATRPAEPRDSARLLVLDRQSAGNPVHATVADLPELLPPRSLLVVNDTRVLPARLFARKSTGGEVELLLVEPLATPQSWRCLARSSKPMRAGQTLTLRAAPSAASCTVGRVEQVHGDGTLDVRFDGDVQSYAEAVGELPLPPYLNRPADADDRDSYQTLFARTTGAVAAPTAGLHFTPALVQRLEAAGHQLATVTLHVGLGTFAPVRVERIDEIRLHSERYELPVATAEALRSARAQGRPIVAVGTTVVRTLESAALLVDSADTLVRTGGGRTELCVSPGFEFRVVDGLLTNFHLPRSTLLMLVATFGGVEPVLSAYRAAVDLGYRFYSYGDAMLIRPIASPQSARP